MKQNVHGKSLTEWQAEFPLLKNIMDLHPVFWTNGKQLPMKEVPPLPVTREDIIEADKRWKRFAPFFEKAFPETKAAKGLIESPLRHIPHMKKRLKDYYNEPFQGNLYLKCDNELPVAGSIKARGGVYEVLKHAEDLAIANGLLKKDDNYEIFTDPAFTSFFSQYSIGVGSTGNLALSIGTISAKLGFNVNVHMSGDAKQWKKELLRSKGVNVYEYNGDFSEAITEGRKQTLEDPNGYFIDDEHSKDLFLGYSVAALRLKEQLLGQGVKVDRDHPLFVYLPCGVGGSPGGIAFGLKQIFGDYVYCIFVEPTHSPSVLIGLMTGEEDKVSVQDFGIDNRTEADGLAVGRPSSFASEISRHLISGIFTIEDDDLYKLLAILADSEGIRVEPSAAAGLMGPAKLAGASFIKKHRLDDKMGKSAHIAWSTGGNLVPEGGMDRFYQKGKGLLR
ncbi:D-serine ammonia-lyase [Scopulibacillus darangshiensis]|uniref:Probable D-serine dehydratase n=1 Tax=Scopulibacillus darangshiensis TaxID=442528 RepID=A0A4V2SLD8_9BACL|nr:D-serine ammonia-lyase [Scopulibacillus darangshiensis]